MKNRTNHFTRKAVASILLTVLLLIVCLFTFAAAADTGSGKTLPEHDPEQLFETYLKQVLPGMDAGVKQKDSPAAGREWLVSKNLNGSVAIYDAVVPMIREVAGGQRTSTEFTVSGGQLNTADNWWSLEDLGIPGSADADLIKGRLKEKEGIDGFEILFAMMDDYPYELYWFDKTQAIYDVDITYEERDYGGIKQVNLSSAILRMPVAGAYAASQYAVNAIPARVSTAVSNINQIVSQNAGLGDLAKLQAYANKICELVEYDHSATTGTPYGDPWQLISIFDGDPNTKVVCEGYAKGFKYLCDLSRFSNNSIGCVLVMGTLSAGTGAGSHMWNSVRMPDERCYLVDLTNSDAGDSCDYKAFLKGCAGNPGGPYVCSGLRYEYDDATRQTYGDSSPWLTLSNNDYGKSGGEEGSGEVNAAWIALQTQINEAASEATIALSADVKAADGNVGLVIPVGKTIILDLAGHKLDRGLTKDAVDGYVLKVCGKLTITDSTSNGQITGGRDPEHAGGINVDGGAFILKGGNICGNQGYYGGGIFMSSGSTEIAGGKIRNNKASHSGGGINCYGGSLKMSGGQIAGNTSDCDGGGIALYAGATFKMTGGEITDNEALSSCPPGRGGGVFAMSSGGFTMTGGTISKNRANAGGGNGSIFHPQPNSIYMTKGGGVFISDSFVMSGGTIMNNTSSLGGGVCVEDGSFTMNGGSIQDNTGVDGAGIMFHACDDRSKAVGILNGGSIKKNKSIDAGKGAGIYLWGTNGKNALLTINKTSIQNNTSVNNGAGIFAYCAKIDMKDGIISDNTTAINACGGAIDLCMKSTFEMKNGKISGNSSDIGGAINIGDNCTMIMDGGEIRGNAAKSNIDYRGAGGGIFINTKGVLSMSGGKIIGNTASSTGGGVQVAGNFTMKGGEITGNTASKYGGGVNWQGAKFTNKGGTIKNNKPDDIYPEKSGGGEEEPSEQSLNKADIASIKDQPYTGKAIEPKLTVKLNGKTLQKGKDYTVSFKDNKEIGTATVTVTGKGSYTGKKTATFRIVPKAVALSSLKAGKQSLAVKWKKGSGIDGYEIEYSLKKDFEGAKTITVKKAKTTSYEIRKLEVKKTYYVRIRAFRKVKGKKFCSEWSKVLSKKTK